MDGVKTGKGEKGKGKGMPIQESLLLLHFSSLPFPLSLFPVLIVPTILVAQAPPISDNSFLIEEAYNQEPGVVQHISTFSRPHGGGEWAYSFTQEWPLVSQRYQVSYTVPLLHDEGTGTGIGDVALNFRYQLLGGEDAVVYLTPRLTALLPTGSEPRGRGAGGAGLQADLPLSWTPVPALATHWNAGLTLSPGSRASPTLGASAVWLLHPEFNFLVETVWTGGDEESVVLNPGVRWAFNFESGLQIVPGVAYTLGLNEAAGPDEIFLYLSLEHPFKRLKAQS
jgi:hypothetical protein